MAKKAVPRTTAPLPPSPVASPINLAPADWFLAPWRKLPPLPRPEPAPFDLKDCVARLEKVTSKSTGLWDWSRAGLTDFLSREEAHFWLLALTIGYSKGETTSAQLAARLAKQPLDGQVSRQQVRDLLTNDVYFAPVAVLVPLANLLPPTELVRVFTEESDGQLKENLARFGGVALSTEFARVVLPYLSEDDRQALRPVVQPFINPTTWGNSGDPVFGTFLAAQLGMSDDLLALVSSWPDGHCKGHMAFRGLGREPHRLLFGLGDARLIQHHMRRLKGELYTSFLIRGWLANTELGGLDVFRDTLIPETNKKFAEGLLDEIGSLVRAPELAPVMLDLQLNSKAAAVAGKWLENNITLAVTGLTPVAGGQGKLAEAATRFLHDASLKGHSVPTPPAVLAPPKETSTEPTATKESKAPAAPAASGSVVASSAPAPDWLAQALAATPTGKSKLPAWVDPAVFAPIRAGGCTLDRDQVRILLCALQKSDPNEPQPLVSAIRANVPREATDAFVWKLFELWQENGFPPKEKWAFHAVGHLGGEPSVVKLTPLIRAWPGQSQHARAVVGLDVLRTVGSDLALMQLNGIAQKLKFQGLKNKAQEVMEAIAADRGLTRDQLGDRIVPTLDLDVDGSRTFDFGPRQFQLVLGDDLKPAVRDKTGAVKADLPKPGKTDDSTKGAEAVESWKLLKKQLKEVASLQVARLEQAMVVGRRWTAEEFQTLLVQHPLLIHLVRRVVWGGGNAGQPPHTFRVAGQRECLGHDGKGVAVENLTTVGIVHPLILSDRDRTLWTQALESAGITQPFSQLDRPVHRLQKDEVDESILTRFADASIPSSSLKSALEKAGWARGEVDQGTVLGHSLYFPGANVSALIHYEPGLSLSGFGFDEGATCSIPEVFFTGGQERYTDGSVARVPLIRLGEVDPVVVSEVLLLLSGLPGVGGSTDD